MLGFVKASRDIESARLTFNTFQHCTLCKNAVFPAKGCFKMVLHRHVASQLIHSDPRSIHIISHHVAHQHSCSIMAAITVTSALTVGIYAVHLGAAWCRHVHCRRAAKMVKKISRSKYPARASQRFRSSTFCERDLVHSNHLEQGAKWCKHVRWPGSLLSLAGTCIQVVLRLIRLNFEALRA